jgi:hypothetical protein
MSRCAGVSEMVGRSALMAYGLYYGFVEAGREASVGYLWDALVSPGHGAKLSLIGVALYGTGMPLFSQGLDTART